MEHPELILPASNRDSGSYSAMQYRDPHTQIHLVTESEPKVMHPNTRIAFGNFFADIVSNYKDGERPVHYWIVQEFGSSEVVGWGSSEGFDDARQAAQEFMVARFKESQPRKQA